jgi:hypothetical protein
MVLMQMAPVMAFMERPAAVTALRELVPVVMGYMAAALAVGVLLPTVFMVRMEAVPPAME